MKQHHENNVTIEIIPQCRYTNLTENLNLKKVELKDCLPIKIGPLVERVWKGVHWFISIL